VLSFFWFANFANVCNFCKYKGLDLAHFCRLRVHQKLKKDKVKLTNTYFNEKNDTPKKNKVEKAAGLPVLSFWTKIRYK
jgi:hypothetical protein